MKKFKLPVLIIMFGTLLSKVLGLVREMFLAEKFGAGFISDAFILAISIPTVLITSFAAAINTNYIPIISEIEKKDNPKEIKNFNGILLTFIFIICTIIVAIFFIFTKQIVKLFAFGYDEQGLAYVITLTRISILSVYFLLTQYMFQGYLEYRESFKGTALSGVLLNIGFLLGLYFSTAEKYYILGYGILLAYILSFLYLFILAKKNKFESNINFNFKNKYLKKMIILTIPLLLNSAIWEINGLIDKSVSSTIGQGYISSLNYANYIVNMVVSVFATSIATVAFPKFVKLINENKNEDVGIEIRKAIKYILIISIPFMSLLMIYSKDIVKVLFFRGEFGLEALDVTSNSVKLYAIGMIFTCLQTIIFKAFYAFQDTKNPTKAVIITITLNIILNILLSHIIGYIGIVLATVISTAISIIPLLYRLNKKQENLINKKFKIDVLKIMMINIVFFGIIYICYLFIPRFNIINDMYTCIIYDSLIALIALGIYVLTIINKKINLDLGINIKSLMKQDKKI